MLAPVCLALGVFAQAQITPVRHVVFIFKENRSFDHLFGTMQGVNGATQGKISTGQTIPLSHAPDRSGNYAHDWNSVLKAIDGGKMDAFDLTLNCGAPKYLCYSQYNEGDIPNYFAYAKNYLIADNFFASLTGPSFPNHQYTIASQSNGVVSNPQKSGKEAAGNWGCDAPAGTYVVQYNPSTGDFFDVSPCQDYQTLADVLDGVGLSWRYYAPAEGTPGYQWSALDAIHHIRFGTQWKTNVVPYTQFVTDASNPGTCTLPAVSWLVPDTADSEHPTAPMSHGQNWTTTQINAVMQGPCWSSTVIFLTWDDNGGYYDHVPPPPLDSFGAGIRVPLLIISPFVRSGTVYSRFGTFDSLLAFVEANWHLRSLTPRDAKANNLFDAFHFLAQDQPAPALILPMRKAAKLSARQLKDLNRQVLIDHNNDDDDVESPKQ